MGLIRRDLKILHRFADRIAQDFRRLSESQVGLPVQSGIRLSASILLILLGLVVPVLTWFAWGSVERALRRGEPLPASRVALPVAIGIAAVAVLVLIGIVLE